jgi:hypothetical protein
VANATSGTQGGSTPWRLEIGLSTNDGYWGGALNVDLSGHEKIGLQIGQWLGIITTYALRDTRALFIPAVMLNGMMIVATLPVGGHYLADVLAGAAITGAAIYASQLGFDRRTSSSRSITVVRGGFPSADGQQKRGASRGAYFLR